MFAIRVEFPATGPTVMTVVGELDIATAPGLAQALMDFASGGARVLLDLRQLTFLDCRGLSVLLAARQRFVASGGDLVLVEVRGVARRVVDLTGSAAALGLAPADTPDRAVG